LHSALRYRTFDRLYSSKAKSEVKIYLRMEKWEKQHRLPLPEKVVPVPP